MTLEAYTNQVMSSIKVRLGEAYDVRSQIVRKNNGIELTGISIHQEGEKAAPVFYLDEYVDREPLCEEAAEITAREITNKYMTYGTVPEIIKEMESDFYEFDKIKDKVRFKLINTKNNEALLKQIPSMPYMDLSVVFYLCIEENKEGMMAALIHNEHMSVWGVSKQDIYDEALKNMLRTMPAVIMSMNDILGDYGNSEEVKRGIEGVLPLYVMTSSTGVNGAACMLYPDVLSEFAEDKEGDIIILPSSLHEVLLLVDGGGYDYSELAKLVKYVNATEVSNEEILSEYVYKYEQNSHKVRIIA